MKYSHLRQHTRKTQAEARKAEREARKAARLATAQGQWQKQ